MCILKTLVRHNIYESFRARESLKYMCVLIGDRKKYRNGTFIDICTRLHARESGVCNTKEIDSHYPS